MNSLTCRRFLAPTLGLLCYAQWLLAAVCAANPSETRTLEFTLLGLEAVNPEFSFKTNGHAEKIRAPEFARSRVVKYRGAGGLIFTHSGTTPDQPPVTTSVTLPDKAQRVTLIVVKKAADKYELMAFPDDASDFPAGHARILNLTAELLTLNYNLAKTATLEPGKMIYIPGDRQRLILKVEQLRDGKLTQVAESVQSLTNDQRLGLLLVKSDASIFKVTYYDESSKALNDIQVFPLPPWPVAGAPDPPYPIPNFILAPNEPALPPE